MIKNKSNNTVLANRHKTLTSPLSQSIGLMFSKKQNLIFKFKKEKYLQIHTFFVFYPINLIFLNENKQIIEIKNNLKPFRLYNTKNKAKYLIEIPINNNNYKIKDILEFN